MHAQGHLFIINAFFVPRFGIPKASTFIFSLQIQTHVQVVQLNRHAVSIPITCFSGR